MKLLQKPRVEGAEWTRVAEATLAPGGSVSGVVLRPQSPGGEEVAASTATLFPLDGLPAAPGGLVATSPEASLSSWTGGFSFGLWDPQERSLRAYRDHYGARPLYYCVAAGRLFLAGDLPALLEALPDRPPVDEGAVVEYLAGGVLRDQRTFYRGVHRLPAASRLRADWKGVRVERYWSPWSGPWLGRPDAGALEEQFHRLFRLSVGRSLAGSKVAGVLLSGGPDSSAVLGMAVRVAREEGLPCGIPRCALTLVFDEVGECDEREAALETARRHGVAWRPVHVETFSPFHGLDELLERFGEPPSSVNLALESLLLEAARREGIEVLLDGHDADTLFSPSGAYLSELFRSLRWLDLARELSCLHRLHSLAIRRLIRETLRPLAPDFLRGMRRRTPPWIRPEAARRTGLEDRLRPHPSGLCFEEREAERVLGLGVGLALETSRVLERIHGVEGRHPYFDPALVRFLLSIPLEARFARGETKILLRRALADLLTPLVRSRRDKTNYTGYLAWSLRRHLGNRLADLARDGSEFLDPYLDWDHVRPMIQALLEGRPADLMAIWRMLVLERWFVVSSARI